MNDDDWNERVALRELEQAFAAIKQIKKGTYRITPDVNKEFSCGFCGKNNKDVRQMIASETTCICDECVEICYQILQENKDSD